MADLLPVHAIYNGSTPKFYFRTSDVYGESGGIGAKVAIKKVPVANLLGNEEIIPVKELLRTGQLLRIGIRYKNSANKRKSAKILVAQSAVSGLFGDNAPDRLEGVAYKIGSAAAKGNIESIGMIRKSHAY